MPSNIDEPSIIPDGPTQPASPIDKLFAVDEPVNAGGVFDPGLAKLDPETPVLDADKLDPAVTAEIDSGILKQARQAELMSRAAEIASAPGFDLARVPVTRPSQKKAKARKAKNRAQRNARKHNRKRK